MDDDGEDPPPPPVIGRGTREDVAAPRSEEVALLVHDVRAPLSVIALERASIARDLGPQVPPEVQRALDRMETAVDQIDRLVSDMLDLATADADRFSLELEPCDLARVIERAIDRLVLAVDRARLMVEIRAWPNVRVDVFRIERVLANLVGNALKFAPRDTQVVIRVDYPRGRRHACVSVIDEGPGLTDEQARSLFARFRRATPAPQQRGTGLGLYISRLIVEAHGGRIGVESVPGSGSRFYFELPVGD